MNAVGLDVQAQSVPTESRRSGEGMRDAVGKPGRGREQADALGLHRSWQRTRAAAEGQSCRTAAGAVAPSIVQTLPHMLCQLPAWHLGEHALEHTRKGGGGGAACVWHRCRKCVSVAASLVRTSSVQQVYCGNHPQSAFDRSSSSCLMRDRCKLDNLCKTKLHGMWSHRHLTNGLQPKSKTLTTSRRHCSAPLPWSMPVMPSTIEHRGGECEALTSRCCIDQHEKERRPEGSDFQMSH